MSDLVGKTIAAVTRTEHAGRRLNDHETVEAWAITTLTFTDASSPAVFVEWLDEPEMDRDSICDAAEVRLDVYGLQVLPTDEGYGEAEAPAAELEP